MEDCTNFNLAAVVRRVLLQSLFHLQSLQLGQDVPVHVSRLTQLPTLTGTGWVPSLGNGGDQAKTCLLCDSNCLPVDTTDGHIMHHATISS